MSYARALELGGTIIKECCKSTAGGDIKGPAYE